jgi:hypothetical protein
MMAGSTRLLVTHQRQYLPQCDRVMVLRQGRVHALGSWQEVAALQLPELTAGAAGAAASLEEAEEEEQQEQEQEQEQELVPDSNASGKPAAAAAAPAEGTAAGLQPSNAPAEPAKLACSASSSSDDLKEQLPWHLTRDRTMPPDAAAAAAAQAKAAGLRRGGGGSRVWTWARGITDPSTWRSNSQALVWSSAPDHASSGSVWASLRRSFVGSQPQPVAAGTKASAGQLVAAEERAVGSVSWTVYFDFLRHVGLVAWVAVMALLLLGQVRGPGQRCWLQL